jgi:dTDP-4-amino-4,6-dideoxygalactose transaminase
VQHNYSYFPILINVEEYGKSRDYLYAELKKYNIFGRRYFYPLISQFPTYRGLESAQPSNLPIAQQTTEQVLCLPIYPQLPLEKVDKICRIIRSIKSM